MVTTASDTLGRTPVGEGSARDRDLYQTQRTEEARFRHPHPRQDSNPQS
jgi:hypothetical protein